jgi:hypothetical protein
MRQRKPVQADQKLEVCEQQSNVKQCFKQAGYTTDFRKGCEVIMVEYMKYLFARV